MIHRSTFDKSIADWNLSLWVAIVLNHLWLNLDSASQAAPLVPTASAHVLEFRTATTRTASAATTTCRAADNATSVVPVRSRCSGTTSRSCVCGHPEPATSTTVSLNSFS